MAAASASTSAHPIAKSPPSIDGEPVYSEEVVWEPRKQTDPDYHYREIMTALKTAASKMPRVDAIGGSSAGIYVNNRAMIASLFRGIPKDRFGEIKDLFLRIQQELGVPLEIINDGDVTALAGSMSLEDNGILGIALGSSEAAGYVDLNGHIVSWLSELAFAPIDYRPNGPLDEWSGDIGCGSQYFSQQCVFRLAPKAGIAIPTDVTDAEKLKFVQEKLEAGHEGALQDLAEHGRTSWATVWRTMPTSTKSSTCLILGRCTSGRGGQTHSRWRQRSAQDRIPRTGRAHSHAAARREEPPRRTIDRGGEPAADADFASELSASGFR